MFLALPDAHGFADKQGREHYKNEGLQGSHQQLEEVDAGGKGHGKGGDDASGHKLIDAGKNEDHAQKTQHDEVTGGNVGKQPDEQGKGLGDDAQHLYQHQDGLHKTGHPGRIENMTPVMFA